MTRNGVLLAGMSAWSTRDTQSNHQASLMLPKARIFSTVLTARAADRVNAPVDADDLAGSIYPGQATLAIHPPLRPALRSDVPREAIPLGGLRKL